MAVEIRNWKVGETVKLSQKSSSVCESSITSYEHFVDSRYLCVREADGNTLGILVKVVGKMAYDNILMKGGEPFVKDLKTEGFKGDIYSSYRFPLVKDVKLVLDILQNNPQLVEKFEDASMHVNPRSAFWVRETIRGLFFRSKLQYYDARSGKLSIHAGDDEPRYRLAVVYFDKDRIYF